MPNPFPDLVKTPRVSPAKQRAACASFRARFPGGQRLCFGRGAFPVGEIVRDSLAAGMST